MYQRNERGKNERKKERKSEEEITCTRVLLNVVDGRRGQDQKVFLFSLILGRTVTISWGRLFVVAVFEYLNTSKLTYKTHHSYSRVYVTVKLYCVVLFLFEWLRGIHTGRELKRQKLYVRMVRSKLSELSYYEHTQTEALSTHDFLYMQCAMCM